MTNDDDHYKEQIDSLRDFSEILRVYMERIGSSYVKAEVVRNDTLENDNAMTYTTLTFEVLINSLLAQEIVTPDNSFLSMLSHITLTLGSLNSVTKHFMTSFKEMKQQLGEIPSDEEMERRADDLLGEQWSAGKYDIEIPDIFKQAFGEENNE